MVICDTDKLHKMVDDFCIEKRPKSIDIHRMINECTTNKHILHPREYKPNYDEDLEVENSIKLKMAMEVFKLMLEELADTISFKQFIEHFMWLYDISEAELFKD